MALYHCKLLHASFSVPFYKALLGLPLELEDLKHIDSNIFSGINKIAEADNVDGWYLYFTVTEQDAEGKSTSIELKEGGSEIEVTNQNKHEYIDLMIDYHLKSTTKQMDAIRDGFMGVVPVEVSEALEPEELELMLCGSQDIDLKELQENTDYGEGYGVTLPVIMLFWEVMDKLSQEELKKFLHFTTGSTRVPLGGFAHLYGSSGPQKFQISPKKTPGLPTAHACFNRLEIAQYSDADQLHKELLLAINETQGFGLE